MSGNGLDRSARIKLIALLATEIVLLAVVTFFKPFESLGVSGQLLGMILTRGVGGILFAYLIHLLRIPVLNPFRNLSGMIPTDLILPFVIVLNNLPIECLIRGEGGVTQPFYVVLLLALECFCIGLFEEMAFRGFFMTMMLRRYHESKKQICLVVIATSVLFGLVHMLNLFEGFGAFGQVMQQVGYSVLVGAMCAVVMLLTGNVWYAVLIHGMFDFCGMVLPVAGYGTWFYPLTIGITVGLVLIVGSYLTVRLIKTKKETVIMSLFAQDGRN